MQNRAAIKFLEQLVAAFCRFPVNEQVLELYTQKLSKWKLGTQQWNAALDAMIEDRDPTLEGLPQLSQIYAYLRSQAQAKRDNNNLGWAHFDMPNGYHYVERVMCVDEFWLYASVSYMLKGQRIERHPEKIGKAFIPPRGATNVEVFPDKLAVPPIEEMPTPEEIEELIKKTTKNFRKAG